MTYTSKERQLAKFLRTRRKELKLTQRQVAIAVGSKPNFICMIEKCHARLPPKHIASLSVILRINQQKLSDMVMDAYEPGYITK